MDFPGFTGEASVRVSASHDARHLPVSTDDTVVGRLSKNYNPAHRATKRPRALIFGRKPSTRLRLANTNFVHSPTSLGGEGPNVPEFDHQFGRFKSMRRTGRIVSLLFTNRTTDVVEKFSARADVTEEFPFLVTKLSLYYDR